MSSEPLVAVLDSSVLVARWSRILLREIAGRQPGPFVPIWSEWTIAETWRVLAWQWCTRSASLDAAERRSLTLAANRMLRRLLSVMRLVTLRDYAGPAPWPELRDPDDTPVWETAVVAGAPYIVSHNVRHFPPLVEGRHIYGGIEYVTAIEFVEDVLGESASAIYGRSLPVGALVRSRRAR